VTRTNTTDSNSEITEFAALDIAGRVVNGRCSYSMHFGAKSTDRAIRLTGCEFSTAESIAAEIRDAIPGSRMVADTGFVAVWF